MGPSGDPSRPIVVGRPRTTPAPDGYYDPVAVAARRAYQTAYKERNKERLAGYFKEWCAANPARIAECKRNWRLRERAARMAERSNPGEPAPTDQ